MPIESPPDGLFTHQRPEQVDVNDIDEELREAFEIIKSIDGLHTILMCQGHPESHEIQTPWSTGLEIRMVYHSSLVGKVMDFKEQLTDEIPNEIMSMNPTDDLFLFCSMSYRDDTNWRYVDPGVDDWLGIKIKYDYETVGQRRAYITVLELTLKEVFW